MCDDKGEGEFTAEQVKQLDEDAWYVLTGKLDGIELRGTQQVA